MPDKPRLARGAKNLRIAPAKQFHWLVSTNRRMGVVRLHGRTGDQEIRRSFRMPDRKGEKFKVGFLVDRQGATRAVAVGRSWGIEMPSFSTAGTLHQSTPTVSGRMSSPDHERKIRNAYVRVIGTGLGMTGNIASANVLGFAGNAIAFILAEIDYVDTVLEGDTFIVSDPPEVITEEDATRTETPVTVEVIDVPPIESQGTGGGAGSGGRGPIKKKRTDSNPDGRYPEDHK